MAQAEQLREEHNALLREPKPQRTAIQAFFGAETQATTRQREKMNRLWDERLVLVKQAKPIMRALAKQRAQTAAGIYAKALVVRGSRTGAEVLAQSLARDLAALPALRASLWPAGGAA